MKQRGWALRPSDTLQGKPLQQSQGGVSRTVAALPEVPFSRPQVRVVFQMSGEGLEGCAHSLQAKVTASAGLQPWWPVGILTGASTPCLA